MVIFMSSTVTGNVNETTQNGSSVQEVRMIVFDRDLRTVGFTSAFRELFKLPYQPKSRVISTQNIKREGPLVFPGTAGLVPVISVVHRLERSFEETFTSSTASNHCSVR